jgi:hypothetical protein
MTRTRATAIGYTAILLWALLALLTVGSAPVPPLQLNAMCFALGGTLGLIWAAATGQLPALRNIPWPAFALGTLGLFGYHALYFAALRNAPPAQAGLIAYLWPLLIVLFSGLLPGDVSPASCPENASDPVTCSARSRVSRARRSSSPGVTAASTWRTLPATCWRWPAP